MRGTELEILERNPSDTNESILDDTFYNEEYSNGIGDWLKKRKAGIKKGISKAKAKGEVRKEKRQAKRTVRKSKRTERKAERKARRAADERTFFSKAWNGVMRVNPYTAAMRGAYRTVVAANTFNLAYRMGRIKDNPAKKIYWDRLVKIWNGFGGAKSGLVNIIDNGKNRKPLLAKYKGGLSKSARKSAISSRKRISTFDGYFNVGGGGVGETILAVASIASPIISATIPVLAGGGESPDMSSDEMMYLNEDAYNEILDSDELTDEQKEIFETMLDTDDDEILGMNKTVFWVGVGVLGVAAIGTLIYFMRKK
jgi:hypothetical protein